MNRFLAAGLMASLNLFDTVSTNFVLSHGYGHELNPIMRYFYSIGPDAFFLVKFLFVAAWCAVVIIAWPHKYARFGAYVGLFCFSFVVGYQIVNLPMLLGWSS